MNEIIAHIRDVNWASYEQPEWNDGDEVSDSLMQLLKVDGNESCINTYNRVLYSIGNNHRGSLNRVSVPAAEIIVEICLGYNGSPSSTALELLCEIVNFSNDHKEDKEAILSLMRSNMDAINKKFSVGQWPGQTAKTIDDLYASLKVSDVGK